MSTRSTPPRRSLIEASGIDVVSDRSRSASRSGRTDSRKTHSGKTSWTSTPGGKIVASLLCASALVIAAWQLTSYFHGPMPGDPSRSMYVDSETGQAFPHKNVVGESVPILSPYSGKNTGYPGVACYWTASGQIKDEPTWVLMNSYIGKRGPTFCPDCGRLVNPIAPRPNPGDKPPPTREELLHADPAAFSTSPRQ